MTRARRLRRNAARLVRRAPEPPEYEFDFLPSEGEWRPIKLNMNVRPVDGD